MGELRVITGSHTACRRSQNEKSDVTEGNRESRQCYAVGFEDGGWDHSQGMQAVS